MASLGFAACLQELLNYFRLRNLNKNKYYHILMLIKQALLFKVGSVIKKLENIW